VDGHALPQGFQTRPKKTPHANSVSPWNNKKWDEAIALQVFELDQNLAYSNSVSP
jgi:hypothetical protein